MDPTTETGPVDTRVTLRCSFCLEMNDVDLSGTDQRPGCQACQRQMLLDRPLKVAGEDFDRTVLEAGAPVLVDFYADWCAPCKILAPTLDEIAQANQGRLLVVKLDTDQAPDIAQRYEIRGVPTVILFRDGEEIERTWGIEPEKLASMVEHAA